MEAFVNRIVNYMSEHALNNQNACVVVPSERMIAYLQRLGTDIKIKPADKTADKKH